MNKIVVIGSIAVDLVITSKKRPKAGETVIGKDFKVVPGGKGANQAVAASLLGADINMIGVVGDDENGKFVLNNLRNKGVNVETVEISNKMPTGIAHIVLAEEDNSIIVVPGANQLVTVDFIDKYKECILNADLVLLQLEIPLITVKYAIDFCYNNKIPVILNPAPADKLSDEIIEKVTYLTPNEHEFKEIFTDHDIKNQLKTYPGKVILTEGDKGVRFCNGKNIVNISAVDIDIVDTTGAGDTFNGALAVALTSNKSMEEAIRFANIAAGISITKLGAQGGMPTVKDIFYFNNIDYKIG